MNFLHYEIWFVLLTPFEAYALSKKLPKTVKAEINLSITNGLVV